jgi:PAS domain S-box-containing protein
VALRGALASYKFWIAQAVVAAAYYGTARLGIKLSVAHGVITPVWAPTGIALAALVLGGLRLWPAVAVGAFVANATTGASADVAVVIAAGNTLEAVAGAYLLRRVGFRPSLDRVRDIAALVVFGAFLSTALAATNGTTALWVAGAPDASPYGPAWRLWWLGDAMGDLLVAPLILVWATRLPRRLERRQVIEAAVLLALVCGVSAAVFLGDLWRYPYLLFPLLIWATFRFTQLGATTASFISATFAVAGVVAGLTPIGENPTSGVQILQSMIAVVAVSLLILAATLTERKEAEDARARAHESLAEAQALAHIGSWEWDLADDRVTWSDELHRIYGLDPGAEIDYDSYLARIHPGDRDRVHAMVTAALEGRSSFDFIHRIVLPDGSERVAHGRGRVVLDEAGEPARMTGTTQDVTERQRLERVRDSVLATVSHEVRTPLTSILGFALTLKERAEKLTGETFREIVDGLTEQALKLNRLLTDLLDLERLRHDRVELQLEPHDLRALVEQVATSYPPDGRTIEFVGEPVVADIDPGRVERIVENLVANAVKYTPSGTRIRVSVGPDGSDAALIRVDDEGPGIADAYKPIIFELFSRGPQEGRDAGGAGVGLAVVSLFASLHGGTAWVEDRDGGGASFCVRLPQRVGRE